MALIPLSDDVPRLCACGIQLFYKENQCTRCRIKSETPQRTLDALTLMDELEKKVNRQWGTSEIGLDVHQGIRMMKSYNPKNV